MWDIEVCTVMHNLHTLQTHQITHMEEIVGICVVGVMLAAVLPLGAADQSLGLLPIPRTGVATLVDALPATVLHRLGVVFAMALWNSESTILKFSTTVTKLNLYYNIKLNVSQDQVWESIGLLSFTATFNTPAFSDSLYSARHWTQVRMGSGPLGLADPSSSKMDTRSSSD